MTKTPEQMAEEFAKDWHKDCDYPEAILKHTKKATETVFLAGYKTAEEKAEKYMEQEEVACDAINHAAEHLVKAGFLAGYKAAMNSPEKQDSCEHILDMEKMVDVNSSSGWISVKERLPPPETEVLWWNKTAHQAGVSSWQYKSYCNDTMIYWGDAGNLSIKNFTHWMPLPKPPEEK